MDEPAPRAPYGFRVGQDGGLEPVPEQGAAVRRVRELRAAGASLRAIRAALERELGERVGLDALSRLLRLVKEVFPLPDPVVDAVDAYRARFGTTPWMIHIPPDRMPAWLEAIREAVRTGRPLTEADLRRVVGHGYPPPGACS
jgi:hypothetical protein